MNYSEVKELISIFENTDLTEMELQIDNVGIRLSRGAAGSTFQSQVSAGVSSTPSAPSPAPFPIQSSSVVKVAEPVSAVTQDVQISAQNTEALQVAETADDAQAGNAQTQGTVITAPLVGTFYGSPAPDQPTFVKVGDTVAEGDVVCIIEAMKFMNEVNSDVSGKVAEILVKDGELVEYGQPLIRII